MKGTREKRLFGIIGNPVRGALSPAMHNGAFRHLGMDAVYLPFELTPEALRPVLSAVPHLAFTGLNVTIPYKEKIVRYLDETTDEAGEVGAVNTIAVRSGRLIGHNTDGAGFVTALKAEGGVSLKGETVTVLGAGGAARGTVYSLAREGCRCIHIANRTRSRAAALRKRLAASYPLTEVHATGLEGRGFDGAWPRAGFW